MLKINFSVLMSIYKKDKTEYVKVAIDSILSQTLKPSQFVIMIDGPISNELRGLLLNYKNCNNIIDLYFRDKNLGLGLTLNEGLKYCKYDYVARMDADDESLPNRFEEQINFLEEHPEIDAVGCNTNEYDDNMEKIISYRIVPETTEKINEFLKYRNPINHPTIIYKKDKVLEVNGYEDYPYFEDYYLWAKMIKNGSKFYNIQKGLYKFRGGNSMYERRGGISYVKRIIYFENGLLNLGLINKIIYLKNVIKRSVGAIMPNKLRGYLYRKTLRKSNLSEI